MFLQRHLLLLKKAVSKLCASNKSKKVEFYLREITQGSKKKTYGLYVGEMKKLKTPIELKGRVIRYETIVHLKKALSSTIKTSKKMKGGYIGYISDNTFDKLTQEQFRTPLFNGFIHASRNNTGNTEKTIDVLIKERKIEELILVHGDNEKAYIFFNPIKDNFGRFIYYEYLAYIKKGVLPFLTKLSFKKLKITDETIDKTKITDINLEILVKLKNFIEKLDESSYKSDYLKYLNELLRKYNISI
jgi:hypothetical protein